MPTVRELREKRAQLTTKIEGILYDGEGQSRRAKESLTTEERASHDNAVDEYNTLSGTLQRIEEAEARNIAGGRPPKPNGGGGEKGETNRMAKRFSIVRGVNTLVKGKQLDGVENEFRQMAAAEGQPISGLGIPSCAIQRRGIRGEESRATLDVATEGADTVATQLQSEIIPVLRPKLLTETLGCRYLMGLRSNIKQGKAASGVSVTWEGETAPVADSIPVFNALDLSPNRLTTKVPVSRQILMQSTPDIEAFIRTDIEQAMAVAVDRAVLFDGPASDNTGILKAIGAGQTVSIGTNGGPATFADIIKMETLVSAANAMGAKCFYVATSGLRGKLKSTSKDSGSGFMIWDDNQVNGYDAFVTENLPSNLSKGTANGICHAALFGDFSQALIGGFGGIDIIVDETTLADSNTIRIVMHSYWDVNLRYNQAFAKIVDATV